MDKALKDESTLRTMKNMEQGAATTIYAALSKEWAKKGGKYLTNCVEAPAFDPERSVETKEGYAGWAYDVDAAKRLWEESAKLVGIEGE